MVEGFKDKREDKMKKNKQEYKEINEMRLAVCPLCKEVINYPDGIYLRSGKQIHSKCSSIARMRRGKIEGID